MWCMIEASSFSAVDILVASVLRILRHTDLLEERPDLVAYKRCEARPAFKKALADQIGAFADLERSIR